jgi:hypothetical protein
MLPPKAPTKEQSLHVCYFPITHLLTQHDVYIPRYLQLGGTMQVLPGFPNTIIAIIGVDDRFQHIDNAKGVCCLCCFAIICI